MRRNSSHLVLVTRLCLCAVVLFLSAISAGGAVAGCKACAGNSSTSWCVEGNVATECTGHTWGCSFSGSWDCGGGSGCFLPGTTVRTATGERSIETLQPGDLVLSMTPDGKEQFVPVVRKYKVLRIGYYLINDSVAVTGDHPFFCDGDWRDVAEIKVGEEIMGYRGSSIVVNTIAFVDKGVRVHNIEVLDPHVFFAANYMVHNKGPDPSDP